MTLKVEKLSAGYRRVPVIRNISFEIQAGQITSLIGLNGAGKSTLLKTILGLLPIMEGDIQIDGVTKKDDFKAYAASVAYVPETPMLYEELTLEEHLRMTSLGYGIPYETVLERAKPLLEAFRLDKHLSWFPTHFSKGMKQKVMIICAMVTDAKLLIIDEPFLGLDPLAIHYFTELLKQKANDGAAILFTTHVLSIAENLCDNYLLLQGGQLIASGDLQALKEHFKMPEASLDELYLAMASHAEEVAP